MKFKLDITGDIKAIFKDEKHKMGIAATSAIGLSAKAVQLTWRGQVKSAGMGTRLANTIRVSMFPSKGFSYSPAAEVFTNADKILDPFNRGVVIRAKNGTWLAIPTPEAGMGERGRKITPAQWMARTGRELRLVINGHKRTAFLVADDLRISKRSGLAKAKGGRRRRDGILTGAMTIPIFILVPQVTLPKRLDFEGAVNRLSTALPSQIVAKWKD